MSAVISACGLYRYRLQRVWETGDKGVLLWVMLNPSTADATVDDATIRRCRAFAQLWGFNGMLVGNLYGYRSTSPAAMFAAQKAGVDIVGPENAQHLQAMANLSTGIVCAWGTHGAANPTHARNVYALLAKNNPPLALTLTAGGYPHHPLRLPNSVQPIPFPFPGV